MSIKGEEMVARRGTRVTNNNKGKTMRNILVAIVFAAMASASADATTPPPPKKPFPAPPPNYGCPGPEYQQFKFWVGEWTVRRTSDGAWAGLSKVVMLEPGCAVLEHWIDTQNGGEGHSLNVFDQADGKWHQTWVDAMGDQIHFVGAWTNGRMELRADDVATPRNVRLIRTMTFEPLPDGRIRQSGTVSSDGGKTFKPSFDLTYAKDAPKEPTE
jgi:hypothetical protein